MDTGAKKDFENPPAGTHQARVVGVFDLGTQPGYQGGAPKAQVMFMYEIVGKHKMTSGANFVVVQYCGRSNHSNSKMVSTVSSILDFQFKPGKADAQNKGFYWDLPDNFTELAHSCLGKPVFLTIVNKAKGGTGFGGVAHPMEGVNVPEHNLPLLWIDFSDLTANRKNFDSDLMALPDWIAKKVRGSAELMGSAFNAGQQAHQTQTKPAPAEGDAYEDDIPF